MKHTTEECCVPESKDVMTDTNKKQRAARLRAEQLRREAEAKSRRTRAIIVAVTTVVVAALVVGVFIVVQNARRASEAAAAGPPKVSQHGGIVVGDASAKVTVTTYTDFLCPICNQFESTNSAGLNKLKDEGKIKIEYVPVSILDGSSNGTKYSTRSASAAYCVMESDPDKFQAFFSGMYAKQPEENSSGLTDKEIASVAGTAGVSKKGQECITSEKYAGYVGKVTDKASANGLQGTPYVLVNNKAVTGAMDPTVFAKALADVGVTLPA